LTKLLNISGPQKKRTHALNGLEGMSKRKDSLAPPGSR
jgi:hypothetical protein